MQTDFNPSERKRKTMLKRRQVAQWLLLAGAGAVATGCDPGPVESTDQEEDQAQGLIVHPWDVMPGAIEDIGVGVNGHVWAIGRDAQPGGYGVHRWTGQQWQRMPGGGVRIAVDPAGRAWVVNDRGGIFRPEGDGYKQLHGAAMDVGIGANGQVFVLGRDHEPGGFGVHRWDGQTWQRVDGKGGVSIAVGTNGDPWVVTGSGELFHWLRDSTWEKVPTLKYEAIDVGIGSDNTPWVTLVMPDGPYVHNRTPRGWAFNNAMATRVSAGNPKLAWAAGTDGKPRRRPNW